MRQSIAAKFGLGAEYARSIYKGGAYNTFFNDLRASARDNGFMALVGEIGAGKTTLFNDVASSLQQTIIVRVRSLDKEGMRINSIVNAIIFDLSNEGPRHNFEARSRQANRLLGETVVNDGRKIWLVIENAHRLHWKTILSLKELREMDFAGRSPLFGICLVGQTPLIGKIERLKEIYLRMDFTVMNAANGWMDEKNRQDYLRFLYGDLLTRNMRSNIAYANETPLEMKACVESAMERAYYAGRNLQESDFEVSLKTLKEKLNLSYREIGQLAGHDRSTVAKVITGANTNPEIQRAVEEALRKAAQRNGGEAKSQYRKVI